MVMPSHRKPQQSPAQMIGELQKLANLFGGGR